ncbi:fibronectin type III domain-containing protein [Quadrisphaera sp. INWT6]|uniref:fibronectin type III domain-containing protein n=1 Tax=Quadrisphaera sp. INWT6 TaxID=2596917 RepID=UPI001891F7AF|nr:fibronectin type III domain-containing protein [Quadrisphaera sp. INWT6]MBF5081111.1 hypothetical protein [Quadrisphaera sp. INWT6]
MPADERRPPHRRGAGGSGHLPTAAALAALLLLLLGLGSGSPTGGGGAAPSRPLDAQLVAADNPTAPTGLQAVAGHRSLVASWTATDSRDNPERYTVFVRQGSTLVTSKSVDHPSTSLSVGGLTNGATYSVTVRVTTSYYGGLFVGTVYKNSPESTPVQTTPLPSAPTGLGARAGDNRVVLTWNKNPEATGEVTKYSVYRGGRLVAQPATSSASTTSFTDTGLTNGTAVRYTVTAVDANGAESSPTAVTATPVDTVRPSPVTGLRSEWTSDGSGQTRLYWTPSTSADAAVQRVVRDGVAVKDLPASATSYTDVAEIEVRHYWSISVVDDDGLVSENDPQTTEIPRDWMAPAVPRGLTATAGDGRVALSWTANTESDLASYRVLRDGAEVAAVNPPATSFTDTGLTNDTAYQYALRSVDRWGNTSDASSPAVTATPLDMTAPAVPAGLAAVRGDGQVSLAWTANTEADLAGYDLFRRADGASSSARVSGAVLGASATSFTDTGLTNDVQYTYTLRARDRAGNSSASSAGASATPTDLTPPAVPARPSAVAGDGVVSLSWTASRESDLASYQVIRDGAVIATVTKPTTTHTDRGVTNGRSYDYALKAVDTHANASAATTPVVTATPRDLTPPAVPAGLTATRGDQQVVLSWTANSEGDLASYRVLRDGVVVATVIAPAASYTDTGLTNGTAYSYSLAAYDTAGNGSAASSPAVRATPADTTAPAVPTGLTAVRGDGRVALTWTANGETDLAGYDLLRDGTVLGAGLGAGATSYADTGLVNDRTYSYALRARDRAGNASAASSPEVSATPTDLSAPAVPARPSAVAGDTAVSLSWAPSSESDLASYRVVRGGTEIAVVTAPTTTYTDRAVTNGTAYDYALVAVDTYGNASAATTPLVSATPRDLTPPAVPAGLTATRGDTRVVLSWTANSEGDLTSYRVLRDGVVIATVTAPTTSYTDTGLTNDTAYDYSLAADDAAGNGSAASSVVTATPTDLTPPAPPAGVGSTPGDGAVDVSWTANTEPDLAAYRVYRGGQLVTTIAVVAAPGTTPTSYRDSGLTNGTARTYAVTAVDTHGNESPTSTTSATPADTTAPGAPGTPTTTPSDRRVTITWAASPADDVATYRVLRDGVEIAGLPATARSYTDTTPVNGHTYAYTVVAVDTAGNRSPASGTGSATPRDGAPPAAPTAVSATPGSGSATVRWTAPADTDLATYRVLRADGSTAVTVAAPATSAVVSGLTNGTPVTFTVVVVDTSGNTSSPSSEVTTTPVAPVATFGSQGAGTSGALAVSPDGRWVVLSTAAPLEGATDGNGAEELYRVDTTGTTSPRRIAPLRTRGSLVTDSTQDSEVALSSDGRYVVLATADALVDSDQNGQLDVYRADMSTSPPTYALVSVPGAASGRTAGLAHTSTAGTLVQSTSTVQTKVPGLAVSADGTRVLFYSARTDLLPSGGTSGVAVFAKDLPSSDPSLGPVALVSADTGGGALTRTPTGPALAVTPDGRYAVFTATGSSSGYAVLRKDLGSTTPGTASSTGELLLVSSTPPVSGQQHEVGAGRDTGQVSVSADGRLVAFLSTAQLASARPRNTGSASSAYAKDLVTGAVTAIGSPTSGVEEEQVSLSPDGATATFSTAAPLVSGDQNAKPDAYRRVLASGALSLVTSDAAGAPTPAFAGAAYRGRVVDLGGPQVVALTVQALDPADTNRVRDAYLKDLATGAVSSLVRP